MTTAGQFRRIFFRGPSLMRWSRLSMIPYYSRRLIIGVVGSMFCSLKWNVGTSSTGNSSTQLRRRPDAQMPTLSTSALLRPNEYLENGLDDFLEPSWKSLRCLVVAAEANRTEEKCTDSDVLDLCSPGYPLSLLAWLHNIAYAVCSVRCTLHVRATRKGTRV